MQIERAGQGGNRANFGEIRFKTLEEWRPCSRQIADTIPLGPGDRDFDSEGFAQNEQVRGWSDPVRLGCVGFLCKVAKAHVSGTLVSCRDWFPRVGFPATMSRLRLRLDLGRLGRYWFGRVSFAQR